MVPINNLSLGTLPPDQLKNASGLYNLTRNLARDPRITDAVASPYDGYPPRLFKDKLIIRPPGSQGSDRHQDYNWWHGFPAACSA